MNARLLNLVRDTVDTIREHPINHYGILVESLIDEVLEVLNKGSEVIQREELSTFIYEYYKDDFTKD